MKTIFLSPDPDDGGALPPENPAPAPTAPPAAETVNDSPAREGDAEEIVALRRKLSESESAKKKVETRAAELEDSLRSLTAPPAPATPPKAKRTAATVWELYDEVTGAD